jgi:hypothetical protein
MRTLKTDLTKFLVVEMLLTLKFNTVADLTNRIMTSSPYISVCVRAHTYKLPLFRFAP